MRKLLAVLSCAAVLMLVVPVAFADDFDPALYENGTHCANGPGQWCKSSSALQDPFVGGKTTLLYYFNTSVIPSVVVRGCEDHGER